MKSKQNTIIPPSTSIVQPCFKYCVSSDPLISKRRILKLEKGSKEGKKGVENTEKFLLKGCIGRLGIFNLEKSDIEG